MTDRAPAFPSGLPWPVQAIPVIRIGGRFLHDDHDFARGHRGVPIGLHCYEYAAELELGGRRYHIEPGDITLTAAWQVARYHVPRPGRHLCIHFGFSARSPRSPQQVLDRAGPSNCFHLPAHTPAAHAVVDGIPMGECMLHIINQHTRATRDPLARAAAACGLQRLLLALGMDESAPTRHNPAETDAVDSAAAYLRQHLDRPLRVAVVARAVGLSQNYLARRFKQRFHETMPAYLLRCRLEYGALLLTSTTMPTGQVGVRVGMPDPQHFNKQFRARFGKSPTAYRAQGA